MLRPPPIHTNDFKNLMSWLLALYPTASQVPKKMLARVSALSILLLIILYTFQHNSKTDTLFLGANSPQYQIQPSDTSVSTLNHVPKVGKVHAIFGEPNPVYERALELHRKHSERNGHPMFVLREKILSGLWSKPAFIMGIIVQELTKPKTERLQWLMCVVC